MVASALAACLSAGHSTKSPLVKSCCEAGASAQKHMMMSFFFFFFFFFNFLTAALARSRAPIQEWILCDT
jgi:hypothetical protein